MCLAGKDSLSATREKVGGMRRKHRAEAARASVRTVRLRSNRAAPAKGRGQGKRIECGIK